MITYDLLGGLKRIKPLKARVDILNISSRRGDMDICNTQAIMVTGSRPSHSVYRVRNSYHKWKHHMSSHYKLS